MFQRIWFIFKQLSEMNKKMRYMNSIWIFEYDHYSFDA